MKYRIRQGTNVLATVSSENEDPVGIFLERDDGELLVGLDLYQSGSVEVGHWPDDNAEWKEALFIPSTYMKEGE
jgi:hypothetical protein